MRKPLLTRLGLAFLTLLSILCFQWFNAPIAQAHWADLAIAEITLDRTSAEVILTLPTGLIAQADDDRNGRLSPTEIRNHQIELQTQLDRKIQLKNQFQTPAKLQIEPIDEANTHLTLPSSNHSALKLQYSWNQPVSRVSMRYTLFEPGVPSARCVATVLTQSQNIIFSPDNPEATVLNTAAIDWSNGLWVTLVGAFVWGAAHAASPGHGKTLVGAYLIGERATAKHAIFLGLTTTLTHTFGVFVLGGVAWFAAQTLVPEQFTPWLSLLSGLLVVAIGGQLLRDRLRSILKPQHSVNHPHHHTHDDHPHHHHEHSHNHSHDYSHDHSHDHHPDHHHDHSHDQTHSHLPPEGTPVNWRSLLALGISGGLIPCPSALVLLLSSIAIGQIGMGLILVLAFSLGLALVLTGLGLLVISTKKMILQPASQQWLLQKFAIQPSQRMPHWLKPLLLRGIPTLTAILITALGIGISLQALWQIRGIPL